MPSLLGACVLAGVGREAHSSLSNTALHSSICVLSDIRNRPFPSQLSDAACIVGIKGRQAFFMDSRGRAFRYKLDESISVSKVSLQ